MVIRDGRDAGARAADRAAPRRRPARGDAAQARARQTENRLRAVSSRGRLAHWLGGPERPSRPAWRQPDADPDCWSSTAGSRSAGSARPAPASALTSLPNRLPTTTSTPGPRSVLGDDDLGARPNCRATSRAAASLRSRGPDLHPLHRVPDGALPAVAGAEAAGRAARRASASARPDRVPALKTLTCTWPGADRCPFLTVVVSQRRLAGRVAGQRREQRVEPQTPPATRMPTQHQRG